MTDAARAIREAKRRLGAPYIYGAKGDAMDMTAPIDCSGLTRRASLATATPLPHGSCNQVKVGREIPLRAGCAGPGHLLFMLRANGTPHHVALSLGGDRTIEALGGKVRHVVVLGNAGKRFQVARKIDAWFKER